MHLLYLTGCTGTESDRAKVPMLQLMLPFDGEKSVIGPRRIFYVLFSTPSLLQSYGSFFDNGFFLCVMAHDMILRIEQSLKCLKPWIGSYRRWVCFVCLRTVIDFSGERYCIGSLLFGYNQMKRGVKRVIWSCRSCWNRKYTLLLFAGPSIVIQYWDCIVLGGLWWSQPEWAAKVWDCFLPEFKWFNKCVFN